MAKTNRETLKGYFGSGKIPTGRHFEDLVDSMLNIVDDGMNRSAGNGLQLSPLEEDGPVLEFFGNILDNEPLWKVRINRASGCVSINEGNKNEPLLTLCPDKRVELRGDLEVTGTLCAAGFAGGYSRGQVAADGKWHDVTFEEEGKSPGCRAYQVVVGYAKRKKKRTKYFLQEARAMHCDGRRRRIECTRATGLLGLNHILMRWHEQGGTWRLQVRTWFNCGEGVRVYFQVTELWQDHYFEW